MGDNEQSATKQLDEALLRVVAQRLGNLTLVDSVSVFPATKPESVVAQFALQYYPERMDRITLEVRVYVNGTFHISYREEWDGQRWMCRWDRHDNPHSARDHFHQPPEARTKDAIDRDYPTDFMTVLEVILGDIDDRLGTVWENEPRDR